MSANMEQNEISIMDDSRAIDEEQIAIYCSLSYVAQLCIASKNKESHGRTIVGTIS